MTDAEKILQVLGEMQKDIKSLQEGQKVLQADVKFLKEGQKTTDLKVEAFHEEQKQANMEILTSLSNVDEINAAATDKRFERIEKHLNLPSIK